MGKASKSKFSNDWILKFGLEVSSRNVVTGSLTSVLCLFCRHFGREDSKDTHKQKLTNNEKYFTKQPWRSDNFQVHLRSMHPSKWNKYQDLSTEDKMNFFERNKVPEAVNLRAFVQPEGSMRARVLAEQRCKFSIDMDIVNNIIGELLFEQPTEDNAGAVVRERALRSFLFNINDKRLYH